MHFYSISLCIFSYQSLAVVLENHELYQCRLHCLFLFYLFLQQAEVSAGNDPAISLRGFRTLWRRGFVILFYILCILLLCCCNPAVENLNVS